eukprot:758168-Hanusia_phi.AAC.1
MRPRRPAAGTHRCIRDASGMHRARRGSDRLAAVRPGISAGCSERRGLLRGGRMASLSLSVLLSLLRQFEYGTVI